MSLNVTTRTTCPYCGVGCGVLATPRTDGSIDIKGDPEHPANLGKLCSKGLALGETFGNDQRLLKPRVNGVDATWVDATSLVAQKFSDAIHDYGPDSVAFYVSGQFLTEDYYVANKLMKGFIGSANIDTNSRLCMASAVAGHKRAFGADIVPCNYTDLESADLVVLVGSNLAWCHPVLFQRLQAAREKRGSKLVVIDPRRTMTAECADQHLQIKSGSDVSLFNGLLKCLNDVGAIDSTFVSNHTNGSSEALAAVEIHSIDRVSRDTGLSADALLDFYALFARNPKTVTAFSMGVNQAKDGTDKVNAIINCHLLTGRIGKNGAGPFSITGQPNAMGGREVGGLANMLAAHMDITNAEHRDAVQTFWKSPRIAPKPGLKAVDLFDAVKDGKFKALWIMATNPAVSMPNSTHIAEALATCPFVVMSDVTANTETARYADILLPAQGWGEKDGSVTNSERRISRQRQFIEPAGEARADWRIMCDVAKQMGFEGFTFQSSAEIFAEHAALTGLMNNGNRLLDLKYLAVQNYDEMQPQQWGTERPFADGQFETPDGKANFVPTKAKPVQDIQNLKFTLNTGRIRDQWHTMTRTGLVPKLFGHRAEPYVELHSADANQLGLKDADLVTIDSGSVVRLLVSDSVAQGELFQPMHWSAPYASAPLANSATRGVVDPNSGQPALKSARVFLEKYPAQWFGFGVAIEASKLSFDYWATRPLSNGHSFECAGLAVPESWTELLRRLCDFDDRKFEVSSVTGTAASSFRCAVTRNGKLHFGFFADKSPVAASRNWLQQQLGKAVVASHILAGRPSATSVDIGPIVCACNGVGRNQIAAAVASMPSANLNMICESTRAGTGCGSCRPEIQRMINEMPRYAQAAE